MNTRFNRLSPTIVSVISRLRLKIRRRVVVEGAALVLITSIVAFWFVLAIDYLPIYFLGRNELPQWARLFALIGTTVLVFWILYRWSFERLRVELKDSSLALLLERTFPQFNESLITAVEVANGAEDPSATQMLEQTRADAESIAKQIDVSRVIDVRGLRCYLAFAIVLSLTILGFAALYPAEFEIAGKRLCLLDDQSWPRRSAIEVMGIKIKRENLIEGVSGLNGMIRPDHDIFTIAKGASLTLLVQAKTKNDDSDEATHTLPDSCVFDYRTREGMRGQQPFKKIGAPRNGRQTYSLDGQPLQGVLSNLEFTVRGGDHRVGPFKLKVVDSPAIIETQLVCEFPEYMVDTASLRWTPRTMNWTGHSRLPQGTRILVDARANKKLQMVYAYDESSGRYSAIAPDSDRFQFSIDSLERPTRVRFFLHDVDGIFSENPYWVSIDPIEDQPPEVEAMLDGIGTAVTPDARIPILGNIDDDYGVARQWVTIETPVSEPIIESFDTTKGVFETAIDFKNRRSETGDHLSLPTGEGNQLVLTVQAEDRFNLQDRAHVGIGERLVLDIVSRGELLRILERLEVGQRRRLEQISVEVSEIRDYLIRCKSEDAISPLIGDSGSDSERSIRDADPDSSEAFILRDVELRNLFAQRAMIQSDKSTREIFGVAEEFDNIRKQLINNRVDTEDRKQRLSEQIVVPLRLIATDSLRQLMDDINTLGDFLDRLDADRVDPGISQASNRQAVKAIERVDIVIAELNRILSKLAKYETHNELLDIVRELIRQQQEVADRTKKERQRKAFEGLLD